MDAKKSSSCSLSSGFTDEKWTPCGRHLESEEIVSADASPTSLPARPLPYVVRDVLQPGLLSVAPSSCQPNAEEEVTGEVIQRDDVTLDELINPISYLLESIETSKTAQELEAVRDEWASIRNLKPDARSGMKASVCGFATVRPPLLVANLRNRFESVLSNRKECMSMLQEIRMVAIDINTMRQKTALTETFKNLKKEATELVIEAAVFCCTPIDSTILSRWRLRDFRDRLLYLAKKLQIEMTTRLIIERTTNSKRRFPEYAVGIRSSAEEVIAQDSGIETKIHIDKENEVERCDNQESENAEEMECSIISATENEEIHPCIHEYNQLGEKLKESLHDIHSFFNGWDWREVANIVGNSELETLERKELVIKDANTVRVHDAIKSNCHQDTVGKVLTSASQIQAILEKKETKDIQRITGIWLSHENEGSPSMTAAKLDLMCDSLRVLALGKFGKVEGKCGKLRAILKLFKGKGKCKKVEGKCRKVFDEMVFFQARIPQLPFEVGGIKKLRCFSFKHDDFQRQKGYSNGYVRLNSKLQYPRALTMESPRRLCLEMEKAGDYLKLSKLNSREQKCRCLNDLRYKPSLLQLVALWNLKAPRNHHDRYNFFPSLKDALFDLKKLSSLEHLPHRLGDLICLSIEINLLKRDGQRSIYLESLAHFMSILCSLAISFCSIPHDLPLMRTLCSLEISSCPVPHDSQDLLRDFPPIVPFSLARCRSLEKLLYSFGELKSLRVLNLRDCWPLKKLPEGLGELKCLVELDLSFCCLLEDFCPDFHSLPSLQILNLTSCESLKKLPANFHRLASLQFLSLRFCKKLGGKSMDIVTKCEKLEALFIEGSPMLEVRWEAMKKEGYHASSPVVCTKEEGTSDKDDGASQL